MANFTCEIPGLAELRGKLEAVTPKLRQNVAAAMYQWAEGTMGASKEIVPVDKGDLMNSGRVELPVVDGDTVSVTLGYGSTALNYALKVHEDLSPHIRWKRPGSGPKYLENPAKEREGQLPEVVGAAVRSSLVE